MINKSNQKINYQKDLDKIINQLEITKEKPKLLLHACCAPCSSYVLEYLCKYFEITIFYYNPNIYPKTEYERRLNELECFLDKVDEYKLSIPLVKTVYLEQDYFDAIKINENPELAKEPEKGERCRRCYDFRMKKAYEYAVNNNFDYYCTTLSISPFKDSNKINVIGNQLEIEGKTKWLPSDFKKNAGFLRSLELSKEYGLYRQQYCGCVYSFQNSVEAKNESSE